MEDQIMTLQDLNVPASMMSASTDKETLKTIQVPMSVVSMLKFALI